MGQQPSALETRYQEVEALWEQLDGFASDASRECLELPATLSSWQRFKAHQRAHHLGLGHRTDDLPDGSKVVRLWKNVDGAVEKYGQSQPFHGVLSLGENWENNLYRTFIRYDFDKNKVLDQEEVTMMVRDLLDLAIDDLEERGELLRYAAKRARRGLNRRSGRVATERIVSDLFAAGDENRDNVLTMKEFTHAMNTTDIFKLVDKLSSEKETWRLAPLCEIHVDIDAMTKDDPWASAKVFGCGCMSGVAAICASAPLSRITILMQTATLGSGANRMSSLGIAGMLRMVIARDGLRGLVRGAGVDACRAAPYSGINYLAYEQYKALLYSFDSTESKMPSKFASGGLSGVTGVLLTYPLDLLRTQTAIQEGTQTGSIIQRARSVIAAGGIWGLWSGAGVAAMTKFPSMCILFSACEMSRDWLQDQGYETLTAGLCSGACGSIVTGVTFFPFETAIKTLQAQSSKPVAERKYKGTWDLFSKITREHGVLGLYRGVVPRVCASLPAVTASFATYSCLRNYLKLA